MSGFSKRLQVALSNFEGEYSSVIQGPKQEVVSQSVEQPQNPQVSEVPNQSNPGTEQKSPNELINEAETDMSLSAPGYRVVRGYAGFVLIMADGQRHGPYDTEEQAEAAGKEKSAE